MRYSRRYVYAGHRLFIDEYPAPAKGKNLFRPPARAESSKKQKELTDQYAARKMAMLILCNFRPWKDMFVTLTHEKRVSEKTAKAAIHKFLDKLRKYFKSQGKVLKYILVNEKQGRWHHHLILPETPISVLRELWGQNGSDIDYSPLRLYDDYKNLTEYLICPEKASRRPGAGGGNVKRPRKKGEQRYSCSKNLEKPVVIKEEIKRITKTEPRPPKGYKLLDWAKWCDEMGFMHAVYNCTWCGAGPPPKKPTKAKKGSVSRGKTRNQP